MCTPRRWQERNRFSKQLQKRSAISPLRDGTPHPPIDPAQDNNASDPKDGRQTSERYQRLQPMEHFVHPRLAEFNGQPEP